MPFSTAHPNRSATEAADFGETTGSCVDEFELIRRFFLPREDVDGVLIGIGDDGAVVTPSPDRSLVAVVDTLIEGVHYPLNFPASDVGFRAVAVNLSDVAAMGATPRWMTLALTLAEADESWLTGFSAGLFEAAREYDLALIGGDTTRGAQTVISVQLLGEVPSDAILTRGGAKPGDGIYVTGTVGDAAGGLALLKAASARDLDSDDRYLLRRFSRPAARVAFGASVAGIASAAIDLSDGLGTDLEKLLHASGAAATIDLALLPVSTHLRRKFGDDRAVDFALDGGDDYELCFTAKAGNDARLQELGLGQGIRIARIGEVQQGAGLNCIRNGKSLPYQDRGYRHF
jgi:thiamine-monophosphate kinase